MSNTGAGARTAYPDHPHLAAEREGRGEAGWEPDVREVELFERALGVERPWLVESVTFSETDRRLDVALNYERGGTFPCPECGREGCKAYDSTWKEWRHLNFFQHEAYLQAPVPRVECPEHGIKQVEVPWARKGSGFTLLFEALVMALVREMPVAAVGRLVGEHDTRLWRILHHYVEEARARADFSEVRAVGLDETASRRGHNYITLFADLDESRLLYATEGRNAEVLGRFRLDLLAHGGEPEQIEELCMDMLPAYLKGAAEQFPLAEITFDRFHVLRLLNDGVDQVRREEQKERLELKRTRYLWLKNGVNLTQKQRAWLDELVDPRGVQLRTARAYRLKLAFQEFWELPPDLAERFLKRWYFWATHSRLPAMIRVARTIRRHWEGVLRWFRSRVSNGMLEAMNSLVQAAKARARGYRTSKNFITMAYLVCGKLDFSLPT